MTATDERLEGNKRVRDKTKSIRSKCGAYERQEIIERNGKAVRTSKLPFHWRERLELMSAGNVNDVIKLSTYALARELEKKHGIERADSEEVKRPYLDEICARILTIPGDRSGSEIDEHIANVDRLYNGALPMVRQRRLEWESRFATDAPIAPLYPDKRIELEDGESALARVLKKAFDDMRHHELTKAKNEAARIAWEEAGSPLAENPRNFFPYKWELTVPNITVLAADTGIGKTRGTAEGFLDTGLYADKRFYVAVPNHAKAEELRETFLAAAARRGITNATAFIFKGIEYGCKAEGARRKAALDCARAGLSPKKSTCVGCPLATKCEWLAQSTQNGPGLKIIVSAFLGTGLPGMARFADDGEEGAPIMGFAIDEQYEQSLMHDEVLLKKDLPHAALYNDPIFFLQKRSKELLDDAVKRLQRLMKSNGFLRLSDFKWLTESLSDDGTEYRIDALCSVLSDMSYALKKRAAAEVEQALEEGSDPDVRARMRAARVISNLHDLFDMIRIFHRANFSRVYAGNDVEIIGCRVLKDAASGEQALHMRW